MTADPHVQPAEVCARCSPCLVPPKNPLLFSYSLRCHVMIWTCCFSISHAFSISLTYFNMYTPIIYTYKSIRMLFVVFSSQPGKLIRKRTTVLCFPYPRPAQMVFELVYAPEHLDLEPPTLLLAKICQMMQNMSSGGF